ncbi:ABC transporter substrate-binding protein [Chelativorans sp. YIM 93263]|uniref:ABC transporter substrate-binding protein n=1 Tax=Chelativorans sp. YIM 93263 TaxID=2906648 RepID=UPI00237877BF|nr:ABC transporter substrate-binding protein [Chelativorans sp. YIM 93263]
MLFDIKPGISRRRFLTITGGAVAASLAAPAVLRAQTRTISVNSWGGPWLENARKYLFNPFTEATGIEIQTVSPVSFAKLAAQVRTGTYEFDVTTLGGAELVRANKAGIIESWDVAPYPGGLFQNGVGSHAFSTVMAWREDKFGEGPKDWKDFWDVERFPGTRSLQRYASRVLPIALLADGVDPDELYPLDIDRAFASLDRIKDHILVWWTAGEQSSQLLRDGEIDMIGIWQTRFFAVQDSGAPVAMTWNQAELDKAYWVVAKDTPAVGAAKEFVAFATSPEPLAGFTAAQMDGPLNPAAMDLVPPEEAKLMPTHPDHADKVFEQDMMNFGGDPAEVTMRFEEWLMT